MKMITSIFSFIILLICLLPSNHYQLSAQQLSPKIIADSKGKDFWLAFPRNEHSRILSFDRYDSLTIIIVGERFTQGSIEYLNQKGQLVRHPFTLPTLGSIYQFSVFYKDYEMNGNGITKDFSFHVTTNEEVTVYGLSVANTSADAFLAFPTDVLGREYVVASYASNVVSPESTNIPLTMSQFGIIAPFDSTVIRISPTAKIWGASDTSTFEITLQKGQSYLGSVSAQRVNHGTDFTGTRILASKPIVVYGSHQRAAVPASTPVSRDYLLEQMLPVEVWGKTTIVAPYPIAGGNITPDLGGGDIFRVIAGRDSTVVSINGSTVATLQAGVFWEQPISTATVVVTSKPAIVATYKSSLNGSGFASGDPFLAVIPPIEQYLSRYRFVCVSGLQANINSPNPLSAFPVHFISVVVPTIKTQSVRLDNSPVQGQFYTIGQSGYSYGILRVTDGAHTIEADTTFGLVIGGYGQAISYGYIGGQRFERDTRPPEILSSLICNIDGVTSLQGKIFDSADTDTKIFYYDTVSGSQRNIRFQFGELPRPADSLAFSVQLLNPFEDGVVTLLAIDSLDLKTMKQIFIPGFTLHNNPQIRNNAVNSTSAIFRLATERDYCFRLPITNYGQTSQTITSVSFQRQLPQFTPRQIDRALRFEPGATQTIEYCFRSNVDGIFEDTLIISNGCRTRHILAIRIEAAKDQQPPEIQRINDSCNRQITLNITDNRRFDAGVQDVQAIFLQNCQITTQRMTDFSIQCLLSVLDPRRDAIFHLNVADSAGNQYFLRDTIQGYTLRIIGSSDSSIGNFINTTTLPIYQFSTTFIRSLTCGTILLENTGLLPFAINKSLLFSNIAFSTPPSQFPLVIPPASIRPLTICFSPNVLSPSMDTMRLLSKFCFSDFVALSGDGALYATNTESRCGVFVRLKSQPENNMKLQLAISPTPIHDVMTMVITAPFEQEILVRLLSMTGQEVLSLPPSKIPKGSYSIALDLTRLESGAYICDVLSPQSRQTRIVMILR